MNYFEPATVNLQPSPDFLGEAINREVLAGNQRKNREAQIAAEKEQNRRNALMRLSARPEFINTLQQPRFTQQEVDQTVGEMMPTERDRNLSAMKSGGSYQTDAQLEALLRAGVDPASLQSTMKRERNTTPLGQPGSYGEVVAQQEYMKERRALEEAQTAEWDNQVKRADEHTKKILDAMKVSQLSPEMQASTIRSLNNYYQKFRDAGNPLMPPDIPEGAEFGKVATEKKEKADVFSLTNVSGDDIRKWVKDNNDDITPVAKKQALFEANLLDKQGKMYRASFEPSFDGEKFTSFKSREKALPAQAIKVMVGGDSSGSGGSRSDGKVTKHATRQINTGAYDKVPGKQVQANKADVETALIEKYNGNMDKVYEAQQIMERNATMTAAEKRMGSAAIAAVNSIDNVFIPTMEQFIKSRNFASDRKKLSNLATAQTGSIADKTRNWIDNWVVEQQLSPEAAAYAVAAFDTIRQVNQAVTTRGGAQKSLDQEHIFFSPTSSAAQLREVARIERDSVKSSVDAYGVRKLPAVDSKSPEDKPSPQKTKKPSNFDKMVAEGGKATTKAGAVSWINQMKQAGWSADDMREIESAIRSSGKWRF
jgi:hypothetical protein